jgi:hypothetical protein
MSSRKRASTRKPFYDSNWELPHVTYQSCIPSGVVPLYPFIYLQRTEISYCSLFGSGGIKAIA